MFKPLIPDMSPIIHPINYLYITDGKENVAPISTKKSDKQWSEGSKFKTPYKDRKNSASKIKKEVAKSKGKDLRKIKYSVAKDSLYFREIMRIKQNLYRKSCSLGLPGNHFHPRLPPRQELWTCLTAKATTKAASKARIAAQGAGRVKRSGNTDWVLWHYWK